MMFESVTADIHHDESHVQDVHGTPWPELCIFTHPNLRIRVPDCNQLQVLVTSISSDDFSMLAIYLVQN